MFAELLVSLEKFQQSGLERVEVLIVGTGHGLRHSGMFVKFARIEETSLDILALDPVTTLIERCVSGGFGAVRRDGVLVELVDGGVSKVAHLLDVLLLPAIKGEGSYLGDLNA